MFKEDAVEKFERMQREIMSNDLDSIPYNTARIRNERRVRNCFLIYFMGIYGFNFVFYFKACL